MGSSFFQFVDILDILLGGIILYKLYKMLKDTSAFRLFIGVLVVIVAWMIVNSLLQMKLIGGVLNQIVNVGAIALIVLFQDEIRNALTGIGSGNNFLSRLLNTQRVQTMEESDIMQIVIACRNMAREKVGALIVIENEMSLQSIIVTGDEITAKINSRLIENIFFKNSPLHDGAMIIGNKVIKAAGCILPLSHNMNVPKSFGLRHRAALGVSEKLDVQAIIVSEETGKISYAENGTIIHDISTKELESILSKSKAR